MGFDTIEINLVLSLGDFATLRSFSLAEQYHTLFLGLAEQCHTKIFNLVEQCQTQIF